ncbi:MAG: hypothetical protein ACQ5SW_01730, partial [Sphaerochaetaceae bacterium]
MAVQNRRNISMPKSRVDLIAGNILFLLQKLLLMQHHFQAATKDVSYGFTEVLRLEKAIYPVVASVVEEAKKKMNK